MIVSINVWKGNVVVLVNRSKYGGIGIMYVSVRFRLNILFFVSKRSVN